MTTREKLTDKRNKLSQEKDIAYREYLAKSQYLGGKIIGLEEAIDMLTEEEKKG